LTDLKIILVTILLLESVNTLIIRIILRLNRGQDDLLIDFRPILHDDSLQCLKCENYRSVIPSFTLCHLPNHTQPV
jgi:hypothetical protein